jgi:excisionase family DNA binding protein
MATKNSASEVPNREQRRHPDTPRAYGVVDTAGQLGIGKTKVRELIAAGELRTVSIGRRVVVPGIEIDNFLARHMVTAGKR